MLYPLLFEVNLFPIVWGGHHLRAFKGMPPTDEPIGESWEVSAVFGKESVVSNGPLMGKDLRALTTEYGADLLGRSVHEKYGNEFPLLIKMIDAERDLSIQVHPGDQQAMERHGCSGKTEMWYVVDANPGAFLYAGFSQRITKEDYCQRVQNGTICDALAKHYVHPGDAFFIPAGCVHSIGAGTLIAEVQQSSDITYRIYDYGRLGIDGRPRQLHTDLAIDVIDYAAHDNSVLHYTRQRNYPNEICSCEFFEVRRLILNAPLCRCLRHRDSFVVYMCLQGECRLGDSVFLRRGKSCLVPAICTDNIALVPTPSVNGGQAELLEIFIP